MNYFAKYRDLISNLSSGKLWAMNNFNNIFIFSFGLVQKLFCIHSQSYSLLIKHLLFTDLSPSELIADCCLRKMKKLSSPNTSFFFFSVMLSGDCPYALKAIKSSLNNSQEVAKWTQEEQQMSGI
jgi:hypothetical protein